MLCGLTFLFLAIVPGFLRKVVEVIKPVLASRLGVPLLSAKALSGDPLQAAIDKMKSNRKKNALVPAGVSTVVSKKPHGPETPAEALLRQNTIFFGYFDHVRFSGNTCILLDWRSRVFKLVRCQQYRLNSGSGASGVRTSTALFRPQNSYDW